MATELQSTSKRDRTVDDGPYHRKTLHTLGYYDRFKLDPRSNKVYQNYGPKVQGTNRGKQVVGEVNLGAFCPAVYMDPHRRVYVSDSLIPF